MKTGDIVRNYDSPIAKDNFMLPVGGFLVVRFKADNPGELPRGDIVMRLGGRLTCLNQFVTHRILVALFTAAF